MTSETNMTPSEAQDAISASRKAILENLNTGGKETALLGAIHSAAAAKLNGPAAGKR